MERLRAARAETGLSQEQVADVLGVDGHTISGWETGRVRPPGIAFYALSRFYGKSAAWLAGEDVAQEAAGDNLLTVTPEEREAILKIRAIPESQRELVLRIMETASEYQIRRKR